jgi:pantothenate kinase-related protein Tda10
MEPMINAPPIYFELRNRVSDVLGPERNPVVIGFDGRDGAGKTSAATWLAWQLGMPCIHLDLFIEQRESEGVIKWRTDDLAHCIKSRGARPLVIEGVLLLDVLSEIQRTPDFLVVVEKLDPPRSRDRSSDDDLVDRREFSLSNQVTGYFERCRPSNIANFELVWTES